MARRYPKRLCPNCRTRFVLWTYPGGFSSCADDECKALALDESMEWADSNAPISREEPSVSHNRHTRR